MKGIVIGAGYVGRTCLPLWPEMIATTTSEKKLEELTAFTPHAEVVKGSDHEKLKQLLDQCDFAIVSVAPKDRTKYSETYLETANTLAHILKERTRPFYLLYTSSTSVYGDHNGSRVDESSPCHPESENGKILVATEQCYLNIPNIDVCILRLGGINGPGRDLETRAEHFSGKTLTGRDIPTNNSPLPLITQGIKWCIDHRLIGVFNLVESEHPTRGELYGSLLEKLNMPKPAWVTPHAGGACVNNRKILETGFSIEQR